MKPLPASWPDWPQPSEDDLLKLARVLVQHVKFLRPEIVEAVTKDNARHASEWKAMLKGFDIDPSMYLWDCSPCAFPGVRRYAGRGEKRGEPAPHCLILDDNDYPKHLWAFLFTGKYFGKKGPRGYQLAHLADHKEHGNRWREEFGVKGPGSPPRLFGLFTSAANTVFAPSIFLKPTDSSPQLRALFLRRAYRLYGNVCRLAPPPLVEKPLAETDWDPDNFDWPEPVGTRERISAFLEFRRQSIEKIAEERRGQS